MQIRESAEDFESVYPSHDATRAVDRKTLRGKRQRRFREYMDRADLDALLLTGQPNVRYVSDVRPVHSVFFMDAYQAILTDESLVMLAPAGDVPRIEHAMPWVDAVYSTARSGMAETYRETLDAHDAETGVHVHKKCGRN